VGKSRRGRRKTHSEEGVANETASKDGEDDRTRERHGEEHEHVCVARKGDASARDAF
jgi:hypothetical protein